jgi:NAD(P)-dependent dehydrogenase (short-subunit alcohol dehydrogenase family)
MKGLKDKRVLITGGARGIGFATAKRFLDEGSQVIILDRDEAACQRSKQELPGLSSTILADVSDDKSVVRAFSELDRLFDGLDVLINNVGISVRNPFIDITPIQWSTVVSVNLKGSFTWRSRPPGVCLPGTAA